MKMRQIAAIVASVLLAACGTSLKQRAPDKGSVAERTLVLQESFFAIIEGADSVTEAVSGIKRYCDRNQKAIAQITVDAGGLADSEEAALAFAQEIGAGMKDLIERSAEALKGKEHIAGDDAITMAIAECNTSMNMLGGDEADMPSPNEVEPVPEPDSETPADDSGNP